MKQIDIPATANSLSGTLHLGISNANTITLSQSSQPKTFQKDSPWMPPTLFWPGTSGCESRDKCYVITNMVSSIARPVICSSLSSLLHLPHYYSKFFEKRKLSRSYSRLEAIYKQSSTLINLKQKTHPKLPISNASSPKSNRIDVSRLNEI